MKTFTIEPLGPFSLLTASDHEFGPRAGSARSPGPPRSRGGGVRTSWGGSPVMRLAFCADTLDALAGVTLRQDGAGIVHGEMAGDADVDVVRAQVARILSLDHDGRGWPAVGEHDPLAGSFQSRFPGFRPVLFHSPYEAAAWSVISGHRSQRQAGAVRRALCERLGGTFDLEGETIHAFPTPARLHALEGIPGLGAAQVSRLRAVADAAMAGRLDVARLRAMSVPEAREDVMRIPGIGPFYSGLVVVRATGPVDAMVDERNLRDAITHFYGPGTTVEQLGDRWRPFRTWAIVLIRRAAYAEFRRLRPQRGAA